MKKDKNKKPEFSPAIENFCNIAEQARLDYEWNYTEVKRLEQLTQDYLHKLELDNLSYSERAKIATKLAECRKQRRASKDTVSVLEPFVSFIESDKGKKMMNSIKELLGHTRSIEKRMETREYRQRVLDETDI